MKHCTLIALLPIALTACGGSNNDNGNPPPSAAMVIDGSNGFDVAQASYQSASSSGDFASTVGDTGLTGNAGSGQFKPANLSPGLIDTILQVPIPALEAPCTTDGTQTISGDLADPASGTLTAGDTITIEFMGCDDGVGETLDGTLSMEVLAIAGDINSGLYELTVRIVLSDFQSSTATDVVLANGDGTATIDTLQAPYVEISVFGDSMLTDTNSSTQTLTDYASEQALDAGIVPSPYTLIASGTLDSSELSGSVMYSTPVAFAGFDDNYPFQGEMLIVGDASSARLIAVSNSVDVVIEIYSNTTGTGTPDSTINTTWAELAGL